MQSLKLTEKDFKRCADTLGIEVAAIKAVKEVESGIHGGFLAPNRPVILFEGHIFWKQLKGRGLNPENYVKGNEDILYPQQTNKHYKGAEGEYARLEKALAIHQEAAICSASWGLFQIMGFNYAACGCRTATEFVIEMKRDEGRQLDLFASFLKTNGWVKYLQTHDWPRFARHYNGPHYERNKYDEKLLKAYIKYATK